MSKEQEDEKLRRFFDQMIELINPLYRAGNQVEPYLYLDEGENANKKGSLAQIGLYLKDVAQVVAYKLDQVVSDQYITHECYAPLLSGVTGNRSMCDYIVFFRLKNDARIHVWAVNMKSSHPGNNLSQLRAAKRVIDFLLGKLEDRIVAETNKSASEVFASVNFVLFSKAKEKTGTNPKVPVNAPSTGKGSDNSGRDPVNYLHISKEAYKLQPLL